MRHRGNKNQESAEEPLIRVSVRQETGWASDLWFKQPFRLGRDETCEVQLDTPLVSREHAEVVFEDGRWWLRDLGSTNGTFIDDRRVQQTPLEGETTVVFGRGGPVVRVAVEQQGVPAAEAVPAAVTMPDAHVPVPKPPAPAQPQGGSVDAYIQRYFEDQDGPAGEHTMMIRRAYSAVHKKQKRKYTGVIAASVALLVVLGGYAAFQSVRNNRLEAQAAELFYLLKNTEVQVAKQRQELLQEPEGERLLRRLNAAQSNEVEQKYEAFVRELGVRRELTDEEQVIYHVARQFGEFEMEMPATFVRTVLDTIRGYWLQPRNRWRFEQAVRRAEREGYTQRIVETMQLYGLPPQFFYLALQESDFNNDAVGWYTDYGYAKGMWQFIPTTGERYGLTIGERAHEKAPDPTDDRHDFEKATRAAAHYMLDIYSTLAQASGLLVMASYKWGEHRVGPKLERLFEDIPETARERNYWQFLGKYSDRMPHQTKDYVIKIFSAAVLGEDPQRFGLNMDNPLKPYLEEDAR